MPLEHGEFYAAPELAGLAVLDATRAVATITLDAAHPEGPPYRSRSPLRERSSTKPSSSNPP